MYNPLPLPHMNTQPNNLYFKKSRKEHHLNLNDLAFILNIDQGNLSNFEAGKISSPKALIGYHILFNISIQSPLAQVFEGGVKKLVDRSFQLVERIERAPDTMKNKMRLEGLNTVITRLMEIENNHD